MDVRQAEIDRRMENRGAHLAVQPMLLAERDRKYLKFLRVQRDAEVELMADVKDWEVGTYYGEKVYKTVPDELYVNYDLKIRAQDFTNLVKFTALASLSLQSCHSIC